MSQKQFKIELAGRDLIVEIGSLAEQANGAVLITYGQTTVLATAAMSRLPKEVDYMPLVVDYEERLYAAGKIKSSRFIKREGRASDEAVATGRMIDRILRPLFDQKIRNEIQLIATVFSFDKENDADVPALIGASLALAISDIPWAGPIAAVRVGRFNGQFVLNPTYQNRDQASLDLVVAGRADRINMLEGGANEVPEEEVISAIEFCQPYLNKIIEFQEQIIKEVKPTKAVLQLDQPKSGLVKKVRVWLKDKLEPVIYQPNKTERMNGLLVLEEKMFEELGFETDDEKKQARQVLNEQIDQLVHQNILEKEKRPDGRKLDQVRPINCQIACLKRTHGSGLFKRGTTQALSVVTLGAPGDEQTIDSMELEAKKRFMHHYNFPPYCVGETGMMRGPGRREIGHGALAERALAPMIPSKETFPYTIRIVSEILSSNGSSSMASVSGSSLALMDAGVPIKRHISGLAMGLMMDSAGHYKVLSDIQGPEDHHGDMDCKIAGTSQGLTACQMDVKIEGIGLEILKKVFSQAKENRLVILSEMEKTIEKPRPDLSPLAPRILTLQINPSKIRDVIGPQGKVINEIIAQTNTKIDIEDSGLVSITAVDEKAGQMALEWIRNLTREVRAGEVFQGRVTRIMDFGAFVEVLPGQEGLVHISELAPYHVRRVEDVVKLGQVIPVKVKNIDDQGRINLSLKDAQPENKTPLIKRIFKKETGFKK